jgi:signal transduction histidine kinase
VASNTIPMFMLAAIFLMAGIQHVLVFMRNRPASAHLWFGTTSLAAGGLAALHAVVLQGTSSSSSFVGPSLPAFFTFAWLSTATWFGVEYAPGDRKRRSIALLAIILLAIYGLGLATAGSLLYPFPGLGRMVGLTALTIMCWLMIDGALRLWSSERRGCAAALGGLSLVLALVGVLCILQGRGLSTAPALYAFLFVVTTMAYVLADGVQERDVMPQRQQELAHASRLSIVGELTASIAHEINQPLGAILSNADAGEILLENPNPPLNEIRQILADIRRDGLRASDVIRHVRKLVRKRELEPEKLDANSLVADVVALLAAEARRRRIPVVATRCVEPAYLYGDRTLLEQMLINLIMNAMDAVEAVDAVEDVTSPIGLGVSITRHGEIEFQIVDAGTGIPPERLDHLFDSFYTSKAHGMGLGLSIARSIVEAHGGHIHAQNNSGAGATFRVTLPPFDVPGAGQPV